MKILHCADLHIRERDIDEIGACLNAIVTTAQSEQPDLAVIAGDVFDSRDVKIDSQAARVAISFISALADICPVAIVIGTPSHDGNAPEVLRYVRGKFDVVVATHPQQLYLEDGFLYDRPAGGEDQVEAVVTLIPQPTKQFFQTTGGIKTSDQEIGQALSGVFAGFGAQAAEYPGVPHILVYHGGISGASMSTGQTLTGQDIEVSLEQLDLARADLNLCGHIHMQQQLGDRTFYAGSPYRTNWGEMEAKGFYIYSNKQHGDEEGGGFEPVFINTPCRKAVRYKFDTTEMFAEDWLENVCPEVQGAFVRVDLTAWQDEAGKIDKEKIETHYKSMGALEVDIRIIRIPRETVRAQSVLAAASLSDKLQRMGEIKNEAVPAGVLAKADTLEGMTPDEIISRLTV